ncbi:glycosyltransferase family 2 protein [Phnomibacter ginsenosidimutans]|uniref:Glycosyltransferase n=1 Tax=Phnomibacter ginsenosidimutans TaxID=2676868 RepID=A0A6I6GPX1_9BACT|nr:glycosyltransferase family 2 protein [Phnomibacter ginsenosidimutans]QGW29718.1 glycosyltransferase [Phnomibacter ginsenosidimutans]
MNTLPLISVVMPCYNAAAFIEDSIRSVLQQTYAQWELIIINDGSTDETAQRISAFSDNRIRLIQLNHNHGIAYCRNLGIQEAKGKYICWLDADDIALPQRLAIQVQAFELNTDLVLCAGAAHQLHDGTTSASAHYEPASSAVLKARLFFAFPFTNSSIALRASAVLSLQTFTQTYKQAEDYILYCRLVQSGEFVLLNQPLVLYRIHQSDNRITSDNNNADIVQGRMIAWRLLLAQLQLQTTDEVLLLHDKITYYRNRITASDTAHYSSYIQLLCSMQQRNAAANVFDRPTFDAEIAGRIYSTLILAHVPVWAAFRQAYQHRNILGIATSMKLCLNKMRRWLLRMQ